MIDLFLPSVSWNYCKQFTEKMSCDSAKSNFEQLTLCVVFPFSFSCALCFRDGFQRVEMQLHPATGHNVDGKFVTLTLTFTLPADV